MQSPPIEQIIQLRIKNGLYVPEQLPSAALRVCRNRKLLAAEALLRRIHCAVPPHSGSEYTELPKTADRRRRRFEISTILYPKELAALKEWAAKNSLLLNNESFQNNWEKDKVGGIEQDVLIDAEHGLVLKRNNLSAHSSYLEFFHRVVLQNWLFKRTKAEFSGFMEHNNRLLPVTVQKFIPAIRGATQKETDGLMEKLGFSPLSSTDPTRKFDYLHPDGIEVNDLHDENVLIDRNGKIAVIDPIPMTEETSKIRRIKSDL